MLNNCGDRDDVTMYYPVMNVPQCEGQLSTYHLNGGSMTTPQSEEKIKLKIKKIKEKKSICSTAAVSLLSTLIHLVMFVVYSFFYYGHFCSF